jgi:hypothetical protein
VSLWGLKEASKISQSVGQDIDSSRGFICTDQLAAYEIRSATSSFVLEHQLQLLGAKYRLSRMWSYSSILSLEESLMIGMMYKFLVNRARASLLPIAASFWPSDVHFFCSNTQLQLKHKK